MDTSTHNSCTLRIPASFLACGEHTVEVRNKGIADILLSQSFYAVLSLAVALVTTTTALSAAEHTDRESRGWKGDGTSVYPEATPPTAWNVERRVNVRWFAPFWWGKAAPVVLRDRVFICEEPDILVCVDRATGAVRWRRQADILTIVKPDAVTRSAELRAAAEAAWKPLVDLGAWRFDRIEALRKTGSTDDEANIRVDQLEKKATKGHEAWIDHIRKESGAKMPICYRSAPTCGPWTGHGFATPVTDGSHVWVKSATGATACFSIDGELRWMVHTPYDMLTGSECSSPVLVDGLLVLQMAHQQEHKMWMLYDKVYLLALDAATGKEKWRADALDFRPNSTPAVMRLPHKDGVLTVIVTGSGTVVRSGDGKVLATLPGGHDDYGGLTVSGDSVFRSNGKEANGVRMVAATADQVTAELLWTTPSISHPGGLVFHDGVLSGLAGTTSFKGVDMFDAATGVRLDRSQNRGVKNVGAFRWGDVWIPPTVTRDHVYYCERGTSGWRDPFPYAAVTVMQRGRNGRIVAHNDVPRNLDAPLVPDGSELFIRPDAGLICIAYTGRVGERYEAMENARRILDDIPQSPPPVLDAKVLESVTVADGVLPVFAPGYRLFTHRPFTGRVSDPSNAVQSLLATNAGVFESGTVTVHNAASVDAQKLSNPSLYFDRGHETINAVRFDIPPKEVIFVSEALRVETTRTVRVTLDGPHLSLWLNGKAVGDQERVTLLPGSCAILLQVNRPPEGLLRAPIQVRFEESPDPVVDVAFWRESVRANRTFLERVVELAPECDIADRARRLCLAFDRK